MNTSPQTPPKSTLYSHNSSSGFGSEPRDTSSRPANVHRHHDAMMDLGSQQAKARATRKEVSHTRVETRNKPSTKRPEIATGVSSVEDSFESTPMKETFYEPAVPAPEVSSEFDSKAGTLHRTAQVRPCTYPVPVLVFLPGAVNRRLPLAQSVHEAMHCMPYPSPDRTVHTP